LFSSAPEAELVTCLWFGLGESLPLSSAAACTFIGVGVSETERVEVVEVILALRRRRSGRQARNDQRRGAREGRAVAGGAGRGRQGPAGPARRRDGVDLGRLGAGARRSRARDPCRRRRRDRQRGLDVVPVDAFLGRTVLVVPPASSTSGPSTINHFHFRFTASLAWITPSRFHRHRL